MKASRFIEPEVGRDRIEGATMNEVKTFLVEDRFMTVICETD